MEDKEIIIDLLNNERCLDEECWYCENGRKEPEEKNDDGTCEYCNGKGFILTDLGESIVKLIKRHG